MSGGAEAFHTMWLALGRAAALSAEMEGLVDRKVPVETADLLQEKFDEAVDDVLGAFVEVALDDEPSTIERIAAFLDGEAGDAA